MPDHHTATLAIEEYAGDGEYFMQDYLVEYLLYPPTFGRKELGTGIPLEPDEPYSLEVIKVSIIKDEDCAIPLNKLAEGIMTEIHRQLEEKHDAE